VELSLDETSPTFLTTFSGLFFFDLRIWLMMILLESKTLVGVTLVDSSDFVLSSVLCRLAESELPCPNLEEIGLSSPSSPSSEESENRILKEI
jgi:hypothetical protein